MQTPLTSGCRLFVLVDAEQITAQIDGYDGPNFSTVNYVDRTVSRSNWFHYCIIV